MKRNLICNQATVEVNLCDKVHAIKSNIVKVKIRCDEKCFWDCFCEMIMLK